MSKRQVRKRKHDDCAGCIARIRKLFHERREEAGASFDHRESEQTCRPVKVDGGISRHLEDIYGHANVALLQVDVHGEWHRL
jgi:hypothetical protein